MEEEHLPLECNLLGCKRLMDVEVVLLVLHHRNNRTDYKKFVSRVSVSLDLLRDGNLRKLRRNRPVDETDRLRRIGGLQISNRLVRSSRFGFCRRELHLEHRLDLSGPEFSIAPATKLQPKTLGKSWIRQRCAWGEIDSGYRCHRGEAEHDWQIIP